MCSAGAPVRLAGVDVGSVRSVRARPELKEGTVEVLMVLTPSYDLKIPNDATTSLETAGVRGETFVEIDAASAFGPAIENDGVLKARPTVQLTTEQVLEKLSDVF
jgi:phospholipid/cholesterol/gamma-HCH transport system substrate-binding protein